jgi:hypothetical protein
MKPVFRLALLGFALGMSGFGPCHAQAQSDAGDAAPPPAMHQGADPQRQIKRLSRKLQLTPQQAAQIEPILQNRQQQLAQLRADTSLTPRDRRSRLRAVLQQSNQQLQAVLSDSQRQQYQQMMQQAMQRRRARNSDADDGGQGNNPPS